MYINQRSGNIFVPALLILISAYLGALYFISPSAETAYSWLAVSVPFLLACAGLSVYFSGRQPESANQALEEAFLRLSAPAAIINSSGLVQLANPRFHNLFGYGAGELEGFWLGKLLREKSCPDLQSKIRDTEKSPGGMVSFHVEGITKTWSRLALEMALVNLRSDAGLLVEFHDVTRETALEAELSKLKGALDQADEAFLIADAEGITEYTNAAANTPGALGRPLKGSRLLANLSCGETELENRAMWDNLAIGKSWKGEVASEGPDGERRTEEVFVYPVKSAGGEIQSYLSVRRDVTARKRSEKLITTLTRAIEHTADIVVVTDSGGVIEYVNPAVVNILGYEPEELIGKRPNMFKSGLHNAGFYETMWGKIKGGEAWSGRITNRKKNGELVEEELSIAPVYGDGGGIVNFVAVARDVTAAMEREREVMARKEEAESANQFKDELISIVSHDLKNPILAALGLTRLALTDKTRRMDPFHAGILQRVMASGEQAMEMIEKLLMMSPARLGRWAPDKKFINLYAMVDLAMDDLGALAEAKRIKLVNRLDKGFRVHADYDMLSEALSNLISNGIKFTNSGGEVRVYANDGEEGVFHIKDTGVGISPEILPNLFKKDTARSTPGTAGEKGYGMGLPFCHTVITKHGGSLTVESTVGQGTEFTISLPSAKPLALLVDDDEDFRLLMKELLTQMGVETEEAFNGAHALEIIEAKSPSILITDLYMEPMNGFELLKELRKRNCAVARIAVTSDTKIDTRQKAFSSGAHDFVNKPIIAYDFIPRVKRLLEVEKE